MPRQNLRSSFVLVGSLILFSQSVSPSSWNPPATAFSRPAIHFAPHHPRIAFTFDDGPHPELTEQLLALLEKEQVPATFFVVGKMVDRYPKLLQHIFESGHEISNHTYNHHRLTSLNIFEGLTEIERGREAIQRVTGKSTYLYRPPGGRSTPAMSRAAAQAGYHMVLWGTMTRDVAGATVEEIRTRILTGAHDGDIVLMHSGMPNTMEALPGVIADLRARGYQFVTVSTLLASQSPS